MLILCSSYVFNLSDEFAQLSSNIWIVEEKAQDEIKSASRFMQIKAMHSGGQFALLSSHWWIDTNDIEGYAFVFQETKLMKPLREKANVNCKSLRA